MGKNLNLFFEDDVPDTFIEDLKSKIEKVIAGEDVLGAEVEGQLKPFNAPVIRTYRSEGPVKPTPGRSR